MKKLRNIRQNYRRLAKEYETRWKKFLAAPHNWVLQRLDAPRNVLDLGCGTGLLLAKIAERFPSTSVTGIDASPDLLAIARIHLPAATLITADLEQRAPDAHAYDIVLSINVLHHLQDAQAHIRSLHAACAENGRVFFCDFALEGAAMKLAALYWKAFQPSYVRAYDRPDLRAMIAAHFDIIDEALLRPDRFWRLQIYQLRPKAPYFVPR